jgi:hypothetical protein
MKRTKALILGLPVFLSACTSFGNKDALEIVEKKSVFIFDCPAESITIACMADMGWFFNRCIEYSASGCGHKAIYSAMGDNWIMTSSQ